MKQIKALSLLIALVSSSFLVGCPSSDFSLHGHMTKIEYEGDTCWVFVDDDHRYYEVITGSDQILQEGLQMRVKAFEVSRKTTCQMPTVIEIYEYMPDFAKDM